MISISTALDEASGGDPDLEECIKKILGAIMVAKKPLTQDDLDKLVLDEKDISAQDILDKLGSVVEKYDDDELTQEGVVLFGLYTVHLMTS